MSPGAYLRQCREAAGLTLDDVALFTETEPAVCAHRRAEWLATIEADAALLKPATAQGLHTLFDFDWDVLIELVAKAEERQPAPSDLRMRLDWPAVRGPSIGRAA